MTVLAPARSADAQLGAGQHQVHIYERGLAGSSLGMLDRDPGWTTLEYAATLNDTSAATVTLSSLAGMPPRCRGLVERITPWVHEVVIVRSGTDGIAWSGPVIGVGTQSGNPVIRAVDVSVWTQRRQVRSHIAAMDAGAQFPLLWHDGIDRENSMRAVLVGGGVVGVDTDEVKVADHVILHDALSKCADAGVDWYTRDRTTFYGPESATPLAAILLDGHVAAIPDVDGDCTLQANVYGVLGASTGNKPAPYGEASAAALIPRYGLHERVDSSTTMTKQAQVSQAAAVRLGVYRVPPPIVQSIVLRSSAPFPLSSLTPGRLLHVNLRDTIPPALGYYKIMQAQVQTGAAETVTLAVQQPSDDVLARVADA